MFFFFKHHKIRDNRSIAKAMLEDRALGQCFSTRGARDKLQYIIITNIKTHMLSHVKNI